MASGELQGWYQDPFGLHEKRYISAGRPTKLVRDGQVDSYDEPPSSAYVMAADIVTAADPAGDQNFAPAAVAAPGGYTTVMPRQVAAPMQVAAPPMQVAAPPMQAYVSDDPHLQDPPAWSPWKAAGRSIMLVVVAASAAILTVIAVGGGSNQPAWAKPLGAGVTVDAPASASPGYGSPGATVAGFFAAIEAKNRPAMCEYLGPIVQALCTKLPSLGALPPSSFPDLKNIALGYIATDGNEALVGTTGTFCDSPLTQSSRCYTNEAPAAILSSGKPFSTLWTEAIDNNGGATYSLIPCVKVDGKWYIYFSST